MPLTLQQELKHLLDRRIVLDDQDRAGVGRGIDGSRRDVAGRSVRQEVSDRHLYGKHRSFAGLGVHVDRMAEQVGQTLDDGKAETEATRALASRIVELVELFEDCLN